jgi:hypothetical protein
MAMTPLEPSAVSFEVVRSPAVVAIGLQAMTRFFASVQTEVNRWTLTLDSNGVRQKLSVTEPVVRWVCGLEDDEWIVDHMTKDGELTPVRSPAVSLLECQSVLLTYAGGWEQTIPRWYATLDFGGTQKKLGVSRPVAQWVNGVDR